jgi:transposase
VQALPGRVAVVYEADRPGSGCTAAWILRGSGVMSLPSKQRPSGDWVKTDVRDAVRLARLVRTDEVTAAAIPRLAPLIGQKALALLN